MIETKRLEQYLSLLALGLLCVGSLLVVRPFLSAILLAIILAISTWPLYESALSLFRGKKTIAAAVVTLGLALALIVPLALLAVSIGDEAAGVKEFIKPLVAEGGRLTAPSWLPKIPLVGETLSARFIGLELTTEDLTTRIKPYVAQLTSGAVAIGKTLGGALIELCIALIITFVLFRDGVALAAKLRAVLTKLAGTRAEGLIRTAGLTLKGVVYGILGTAIVQGILAAVGFALAGVPAAALLGMATAFFSLVPIGPPMIWIPAVLWLFSNGETGWAIFLAIWGTVIVSGSDNVVKPYLISKGSDLPILLIFAGVMGGVLQFGFLGVFLGPTLLALLYSLVKEWISQPGPRQKVAEVGSAS